MILHTLNASPRSAAFSDCMALAAPGDAILLMGDGVYAALAGSESLDKLLATGANLHMLKPDALAAGVVKRSGAIEMLDIDGFVALTERYPRQQAWY